MTLNLYDDDDDTVEIPCEVRHATEKATLIFDGTNEFWIPKSRTSVEWCSMQGCDVATVPRWLAKKSGMI